MLTINTHRLIMACYEDLQKQHPRTPVTAGELSSAVGDYYNTVRDMKLMLVAEWVLRHFGLKLADWFEAIAAKVAKVDEPYYIQLTDMEQAEPEERANCAASALAVVLFYRAEDRGQIMYRFEMSEEEAAAWIQKHGTAVKGQLSLFSAMGA